MNYLALFLFVLIGYLIEKILIEKENYSTKFRVLSGSLCLITVILIFIIQEYRKENYHFLFGVLPNFLSAVCFPFLLTLNNRSTKIFFINKFFSWSILTFVLFILYECLLWVDGRNFDVFDILFTLFGAMLSGLTISKLNSKFINGYKE